MKGTAAHADGIAAACGLPLLIVIEEGPAGGVRGAVGDDDEDDDDDDDDDDGDRDADEDECEVADEGCPTAYEAEHQLVVTCAEARDLGAAVAYAAAAAADGTGAYVG